MSLTPPSTIRAWAPLPLLFALQVCALQLGCVRTTDAPAVVEHRTPAQVMSFRSADWLEREDRIAQEQPKRVIATMGIQPGDTVADIGCGTGFFARRLARAVSPGGTVYAVDVQPEMLEKLQRYAAAEGIENIQPILSTDRDPALPRGKIDWILLADVYHEMQEPEAMLSALRASLAPGGKVALLEYRAEDDSAAHIHHDHRMTVQQVLSEWEPAGFELEKLHEFLPAQHFFIFRATG